VRSYNIAMISGSVESSGHSMGINHVRAINRIGGHKITHIDYKNIYKQNGPGKALELIENELNQNNIDIIIYFVDYNYEFPIEFFSKLRKRYFTVMYAGGDDEHYFDKSSRYYSQAFDLVITIGPNVVRYELYGVDAIPGSAAFDVSSMQNPSYKKNHDVCFVGAVGNKVGRQEYLSHLIENNINVKIAGSGTIDGIVNRDRMNLLYGSSKIGLGFSGVSTISCLDRDITINRRMKALKGRSQEIALTGSFVLAEYAPGIEENFNIGSEIDIFRDKDELLTKIKYYLKNDAKREEMASKAFDRVIHDCNEINVWGKYLQVFENKIATKNQVNLSSQAPIYKDPIFKRAFSAFHLFKMLEFLLRGMPRNALAEFVVYIKYPLIDRGVFLYHVNHYVVGFLGSIKWILNFVRAIKKLTKKNHIDEGSQSQ